MIQLGFFPLTFVWIAILSFVLVNFWSNRKKQSGIVTTYIVLFWITFGVLGVVYTIPWYKPMLDVDAVFIGYQYATLGLVSLVCGVYIAQPFLKQINAKISSSEIQRKRHRVGKTPLPMLEQTVPTIMLIVGLASTYIFYPMLSHIPSIGAFTSQLSTLTSVAIVLVYAQSATHTPPKRTTMMIMLGLSLLNLFVILAFQGFLWFGMWPLLFTILFSLRYMMYFRRMLLLFILVAYMGLSLYVTYISARTEIRSVTWSDAGVMDRVDTIYAKIFENFALFGFNEEHFNFIEARLSLTHLTGVAIQRIQNGNSSLVYGNTILDGVIMLVPRILWPDKPLVIGGSAAVTQFTGVYFYGKTTVGMGPVMEFYVNFGPVGVIGGFMILGIILRTIDSAVAKAINSRSYTRAAIWILPAFAFWIPEDNSITVFAKFGSALVTIWVLTTLIRSFYLSPRGALLIGNIRRTRVNKYPHLLKRE